MIFRHLVARCREHLSTPVTLPLLLIASILAAMSLVHQGWFVLAVADQSHALALFLLFAIGLGLFLIQVGIQIVAHELGHALVAILVRLRIHQIKLGPIIFSFAQGKARLQTSFSLRQPAGYVMAFATTVRAFRFRMALFILGGPFANLVTGMACLYVGRLLYLQVDSGASMSGWRHSIVGLPPRFVAGFIYVAGVFGIGFAFLNLIPFRITTEVGSDGARLLSLLKTRPNAIGWRLVAELGISMQKGQRPRDWEPSVVRKLLACRKGAPEESGWNLYCYYYALDGRDLIRAGDYLSAALAQYMGYSGLSRSALFLEGAYFEARHNSNVAAAFGWLAEANQEERVEEQTHCRAEAALLWARGRYEEGARRAEAGLKAISLSRDIGGSQAEKEWLEELLSLCNQGIAKASD